MKRPKPPTLAMKALAVVQWAAELTDPEIEGKDPISLSFLYGLRKAAQQVMMEAAQGARK